MFENTSKCEDCLYYEYDDEYGFYVCDMDLDEDETAQFIGGRFQNCPYYRPGDEYTIVRKQIKTSVSYNPVSCLRNRSSS